MVMCAGGAAKAGQYLGVVRSTTNRGVMTTPWPTSASYIPLRAMHRSPVLKATKSDGATAWPDLRNNTLATCEGQGVPEVVGVP
jgi:hypothetical protein